MTFLILTFLALIASAIIPTPAVPNNAHTSGFSSVFKRKEGGTTVGNIFRTVAKPVVSIGGNLIAPGLGTLAASKVGNGAMMKKTDMDAVNNSTGGKIGAEALAAYSALKQPIKQTNNAIINKRLQDSVATQNWFQKMYAEHGYYFVAACVTVVGIIGYAIYSFTKKPKFGRKR